MRPNFDILRWERDLLAASSRRMDEGEKEFLRLVDAVSGRVYPAVARILMKTFTDRDDFGTQERVCSVLATGNEAVVLDAMLRELPRLVREAPEWAECLLGDEVTFRMDALVRLAQTMPPVVKAAIAEVAIQPAFLEDHPQAAQLATTLMLPPDA